MTHTSSLSFYTMKDIQFMIGDWALLDGKPVQVDNANIKDDLKPMPLTIPILAGNGFVIGYPGNPCISAKYHNDGLAVLSLPHRKDSDDNLYTPRFILRLKPNGKSFDIHYTVCCVDTAFKYVHQLQHALRLVGHDVDIDVD